MKKAFALGVVAALVLGLAWVRSTQQNRSEDLEPKGRTDTSRSEPEAELPQPDIGLAAEAPDNPPDGWAQWPTQRRLTRAYNDGVLSVDEYLVLGVRSIVDPESLPAPYQSSEIAADPSEATIYEYLEVWDDASTKAQAEASRLLNDPTSWSDDSKSGSRGGGKSSSNSSRSFQRSTTSSHFSVSWNTLAEDPVYGLSDTPDAETWIPGASPSGVLKSRKNRQPDFVDRVIFALEEAYADYIGMGYKAPLFSPIPVIIGNPPCVGSCPGYASPVSPHTIYIAPPPDSPQRDPIEVTVSEFYLPRHELFHVFEYQYKWGAELGVDGPDFDFWWLEATAEWASHKSNFSSAYPSMVTEQNNRYARLLPSAMSQTSNTLMYCPDFESECYGDFIFAELLEQRFGRDIVRQVWEEMSSASYPTAGTAMETVLNARGSSLAAVLPDYARSIYRIGTDFVDQAGDTWGTTAWLSALESLGTTASRFPGLFPGSARPSSDLEIVTSSGVESGEAFVEPGGTHFVDVVLSASVPDQTGWVSITATGSLADVNLQVLPFATHPTPCVGAQVRSQPGGYIVRLGSGCNSATLAITRTDALSPRTTGRLVGWEAELVPGGPIEDGAAGYWRLGEASGLTAVDATGNGHNGTYPAGMTYGRPGAFVKDSDTAVRFAGQHPALRIPASASFQTSNATVEAWVRPKRDDRQDVINRGGTEGQMALSITENSTVQGNVVIGGTRYKVTGQKHVAEGQWHHIALTYDGSAIKLFVDGELDASRAQIGSLDAMSGAGVDIGYALNCGGCEYVGDIDEVAFYPRALSEADIRRHFDNAGTLTLECQGSSDYATAICADSPLGYWRLGDAQGSTEARDLVVPRNDGSYQSGATPGVLGALPQEPNTAARFDGADDKVRIPYDEYGRFANRRGSIEAWFRTTDRGGAHIVNRGGTVGQLALSYDGSGRPSGHIRVGGLSSSVTGTTDVAEGRWHHLAMTYDGSVQRLYVDGEIEGTANISGGLDWYIGYGVDVGYALNCGGCELAGDVDEVALYDHALTEADVQERITIAGVNDITCQGGTSVSDAVCASKPVGYWKLNEPLLSVAASDSTSVASNGSYQGGVALGEAGVSGTSARFDGADDKVRIPYDPYGRYANDKGSVEAWFKTSDQGGGWIVNRGGTVGQLSVSYNSAGRAVGHIKIGGISHTVTGSSNVANGSWHHVVLTYDGTTERLYVDGVEESANPIAGKLDWFIHTGIDIGYALNCGGCEFAGHVDEVALYDRALAPTEVQTHKAASGI